MYERRLAWRLFVAYFLVTLVALAALGWYGSYVLDEALASGLSRQLQTTAQLVAQQIEPVLGREHEQQLRAEVARASLANGSRITVILPSGEVLADTRDDPERMDNHARRPEVQAALAGEIRRDDRFSNTLGEPQIYVAVPVIRHGAVLGVV